jgi:hypothetical protein
MQRKKWNESEMGEGEEERDRETREQEEPQLSWMS